MSTIAEHLAEIERQIHQLNIEGHVTEADEFIVISDLEIAIHEVRKVFERMKKDV